MSTNEISPLYPLCARQRQQRRSTMRQQLVRGWVAAALSFGGLACDSDDDGNASGNGEGGSNAEGGDGTSGGMLPSGDDSQSGASMSGPGESGASNSGQDDGGQDDGGQDDGGQDDSGQDDGGFITPPDGGIEGQCDPAAQDCPRGQKCTSYVATPGGSTVDATRCVEVTGNDQWGESCERMEGNDTCAAGFFCMTDVSGNTGQGFCLEYCEINQPCEFGGECFAFNDGALPVCEVTCDPLAPSCPQGQGCYAAFENFVCAIPGAPDGMGADGDPCSTIQSCNPGLICRGGTAGCEAETACCTPYCDLNEGNAQCPTAGESCVPALDNPLPGLEEVGYCTIPE